jgi:TatD DNase family protein
VSAPTDGRGLFDTHCHLNHLADVEAGADEEWRAAWTRARSAGVSRALVVGIDADSSEAARRIALGTPGLSWSAGLHPTSAGSFATEWPRIEAMLRTQGACAVGETGFDFYWKKSTPDEQHASFAAHVRIARELDLPVVIHCRDAFDATFAALDAAAGEGDLPRCVMHCFSGGIDEARSALERGLYLSFAGPLTYPRSDALRAAAAFAPEDRILVETDAPYLPPQRNRGKRNEPAWVVDVARELARVRETTYERIVAATADNATRLFDAPA